MGKHRFIFRFAFLLLILVLASFLMLTGLLARYTNKSEAGSGARVAAFDVSAVGAPANVFAEAKVDGSGTYTVTLTNASEVAVAYAFQVTVQNLPAGTSFNQPTGELAALSGEEVVELVFEITDADAFAAESGVDYSNDLYSQACNFDVTVVFTQID